MEVNGNNERFVAGGGTLALGIIGTALGGLNALAGGNGVPLLGGNRAAADDSRIAKLEAERYTDAAVIAAQARNAEVRELEVKNAEDIKALRTEFELRAEIDRKQAKIDLLEATAPMNDKIGANTAAIAAVREVLSGFTKVVIPTSAVMPSKA